MTTPIDGIAFRDETMWCDWRWGHVDYRCAYPEEEYNTNIVVMTIDVSEEFETWAGSFDSKDWSKYLKLLKGDWNDIAAVMTNSSGTDGRKAPLGVFALMQELVNRVTNIDFFEEEPEFLKGEDDGGEFFYVVHEGKNYLIEQ